MEYIVSGRHPAALFRYFEELSAIPRASGDEKAASDFLMSFARAHSLEAHQDAMWNVVIKKPGSPGCEKLPPIMLQGHMDMVCEKNTGVRHDFARDGLRLFLDGGYLRAEGTTLGADNGVAVAMMMAILEDQEIRHPPLECVFTVQEETGLYGAAGLDPALIQARTMINLDSEEEGIATVSCAGGMTVCLKRPVSRSGSGEALKITIKGLQGGHSGSDIHLGRGNANHLMGRLISDAVHLHHGRLAGLNGGNKDNAIPRECEAFLTFGSKDALNAAAGSIRTAADILRAELAGGDPGFEVSLQEAGSLPGFDAETTVCLSDLLLLSPDGVQSRSPDAGGFVVSSLNLGVVRTEADFAAYTFSLRSSAGSCMELMRLQLERLAARLGFHMECSGAYPGWAYAAHSPVRDAFQACFRALFRQELRCESIHAGLECGLFCGKLPGLDAIAVGPSIYGCHTPDERLDLASCERTYRLVAAVLESYAANDHPGKS